MVTAGKIALAAAALATAGYGLIEFRGPHGYAELVEKRSEVQRLKKQNKDIEDEVARLQKRVEKLSTDPAAQELEIRKRNGLLKPGETVYLLQDKSLKPYSAATAPAK
jgi:cell division protein FtsB